MDRRVALLIPRYPLHQTVWIVICILLPTVYSTRFCLRRSPFTLSVYHSAPDDYMADTFSNSFPIWVASDFGYGNLHFLSPYQPLVLGSFDVLILMHAGQHTYLALTRDSLTFDICSVSKMQIQDSRSAIQLTVPNDSSKFFLCTSGDRATPPASHRGIGIIPSGKVEMAIFNWIPANGHLCTLRLSGPFGIRKDTCAKRNSSDI